MSEKNVPNYFNYVFYGSSMKQFLYDLVLLSSSLMAVYFADNVI